MTLTSGSVVAGARGSYIVEGEITRGGMGIVYAGVTSSGQKVVIKEPYFKGDAEDPVRLEKLQVEAKVLVKVKHKNIVRYIDERKEGRTFYLILEYVPGTELRKIVNPSPGVRRPLPDDETKLYSLELLDAVRCLHQKNIIHRDINPKNILKHSDITLIDFGTAKDGYTQLLTFGHTIVGTPGWSAPEQFRGVVTPQCDIYAIGATMFFLLTGYPPNVHMSSDGTLLKTPKKINPRISETLSQAVVRAMNVDPANRFRIADEMIKAIEGLGMGAKAPSIYCLGNRYPITGTLTIGRLPPSNVVIPDQQQFVSRRHAQVYFDSGKYWIEDLDSLNGTFVFKNGVFQKIQRYELQNNDLIALCYRPDKGPYITLTFSSS